MRRELRYGFGMAVTDEAIDRIKQMIISGRFAPGARLPPEQELSAELGLSRSSLREAVKALEVVRVLDVRRGDGTYVTSLEPRLLLEATGFIAELQSDTSMLELTEVRRVLEPAAAAMAATRMDDEALAQLLASVEAIEGYTSIEQIVAHDLDFHRQIARSSGNSYLAGLIDALSGETTRMRVWRGIADIGAADRTIAEHRSIYVALAERDGPLAGAHMLGHIAGVERWLRHAKGEIAG